VGRPAARITDPVVHPLPPVLTPGPGSLNVLIGSLPAWRGVPAAAAAAIQSAKAVSDAAIQVAEAATLAAAGTPGLPAAKAAEETAKATAAASMGSMISAAAGAADIHVCATPLPLPPHGPGVIIDGSQTVLINGLPACRQGDTIIEAVGPPNKVAMGLPTVLIGDAGGGGGGLGEGAGAGAPAGAAGAAAGAGVGTGTTYGTAIKLEGDEAFRNATIADLDKIKSTPTGKAMLEALEKSGKTVTIKPTTGGNGVTGLSSGAFKNVDGTKGTGSGSTVSYNPKKKKIGNKRWEKRPPAVGLAHELVHAVHAANGDISTKPVKNDSKPDPSNPKAYATEKEEEVRTVGIAPYDKESYSENKIRSEWDPKQTDRKWY
jgi:uncharacterized Zn-binding protein involved in type VI secretion